MTIRRATTDDLEHFLRHGLDLRDLEESFGFNGYLEDDQEFIKEYSRFLVLAFEQGHYEFYVAEDDGEVVGTLIGCLEPAETFYRYQILGCIRFIWIEPEHREAGVAKALVETFEDRMRELGIEIVYATINQWNSAPQFKLLHHGWNYEFVQLFRRT